MRAERRPLILLGIGVCVALLWWAVATGSKTPVSPTAAGQPTTSTTGTIGAGSNTTPGSSSRSPSSSSRSPSSTSSRGSAATPLSGLDWVAESALPPQARGTLELIRDGGPYPFDEDDGIFPNRERNLPRQARGYYREYTVVTPGSRDRGARRIFSGTDGDRYYTDDHYDSFRQIEEGE